MRNYVHDFFFSLARSIDEQVQECFYLVLADFFNSKNFNFDLADLFYLLKSIFTAMEKNNIYYIYLTTALDFFCFFFYPIIAINKTSSASCPQ